jgi:hypothetical protein
MASDKLLELAARYREARRLLLVARDEEFRYGSVVENPDGSGQSIVLLPPGDLEPDQLFVHEPMKGKFYISALSVERVVDHKKLTHAVREALVKMQR